ncbi:MAG: GNAT family N-acetyltransferase [Dechloromonas sp.]|nr:GNAT family N-acetyltransferase [Dechloromonas sp.]
MKFSGQLTYLVPFLEEHLEHPCYIEWLRDVEVVKYIGREEYLLPIHYETVRDYVRDLWNDPTCAFFAVYRADQERFVGTAKVSFGGEAGLRVRIADLGIMIGDKASWGGGFASDVIATMARYALDVLGARKLSAGAVDANAAVIQAFKKSGFVEEGRLRQKVFVGGEYRDHVLLGCLREEFRRPEI